MSHRETVRILIVDDHPVVRRGIAFSLSAFDDLSVVADASSGSEAVQMCEQHRPDVAIMDMMMPGTDGPATIRLIRERFPSTQVLVFTSFPDARLVRDALKAGAIGYLLKDVAIDELAQAVRNASRGQSTLHRAATQALVQPQSTRPELMESLTERQREVLALVAQGRSNQEIAAQVFVSLSTVRFHVSTILAKLGAANRAEAAAISVKYHLLD